MVEKKGYDQILEIVLDKTQITWQSIIYDLISSEQMDPWDIDISLLTKKYIEMIKLLKEHDFRVSGKVILAAAMLLKIKSNKWIKEDIANLDALFASAEQEEQDLLAGIEDEYEPREIFDAHLIPRTPQPRKRKVSVYDLVAALEKALEVKHRRILREMPILDVKAPQKKREISEIIKDIYQKIMHFFSFSEGRLTFTNLAESSSKVDKVYTFIPLLHLTNQRKIDLEQYQPFGEIEIILRSNVEVNKELEVENQLIQKII
jgi:segregation and condensation protein A